MLEKLCRFCEHLNPSREKFYGTYVNVPCSEDTKYDGSTLYGVCGKFEWCRELANAFTESELEG